LNAALSNIISGDVDPNLHDYSMTDNRIIYLVLGYDGKSQAEGVGYVALYWTLTIQSYKDKSKSGSVKHKTTMNVSTQSILYNDIDLLLAHYNWVINRHPSSWLVMGIPPAYHFQVEGREKKEKKNDT